MFVLGTNINSALSVAVDLIRKGVKWEAKANSTASSASTSTSASAESTSSESPKEDRALDAPADNKENGNTYVINF